MSVTLPSVEAGDSKKVPDHLTWPAFILYPLVLADIQLTLPLAESFVVSFLNKMTQISFKQYLFLAVNAKAVGLNVLVNGLSAVCTKPNFMNIIAS